MLRRHKGQIFTADLFFAILFFLFLFSLYTFASASVSSRIQDFNSKKEMWRAISDAGRALLSEGNPPDWDSTNLHSIGLAEREGVLSRGKIERFLLLDYERSRELLGLYRQGRSFDYSFTILNMEDEEIYSGGKNAPEDESILAADRYAMLDGKLVRIHLEIWGR